MKEQWNKDIHDRLKDFPKKAPEGLLDDIQSEMLHRGLSPAPMPRKNKHIFLRIASAAAVLLILLGISHLWERQPIVHPEEHIFVPTAEEAILPVCAEEEENEQESTPTTPVIHKVMAEAQTPVSHPDTLASEKENVVSETKEEKSQECPKDPFPFLALRSSRSIRLQIFFQSPCNQKQFVIKYDCDTN